MKLLIAGTRFIDGRPWADYDYVCDCMELFKWRKNIQKLLSGGAPGADRLGEKWIENEWPGVVGITSYLPDYQKHGSAWAPLKRNEQMADDCDFAVLFWDGLSKGTGHMFNCLRSRKKETHIFWIK